MATTVSAPRSDTVSDDRRGGAPRRRDPHAAGVAPWLFLAPYLVLFIAFVVGLIVYGLYISLHRSDFTLPNKPFVGLENYTDLFTPGSITFSAFWHPMRATAIFTLFSMPLLLVVPLVTARPSSKKFPGRNVFRAVLFGRYVLGVAVIGSLLRYLLGSNIGLVIY